MFNDPFSNTLESVVAPASDCFAITPHDTDDLPKATKALFIGVGGDVVLQPVSGSGDITFRNLPDGSVLDVRVRAIRATGTTAANLVGLA
ncbi:MAG: hypothetical protein HRT64_07845 [Erythrobacter sp.]|nr:hypothetical protein [Erythrobacter sp.]